MVERLFGAVTFGAYARYRRIAFHASLLLEQILPGFRWLRSGRFLLRMGVTCAYETYTGFVFTLIRNRVLRRLR